MFAFWFSGQESKDFLLTWFHFFVITFFLHARISTCLLSEDPLLLFAVKILSSIQIAGFQGGYMSKWLCLSLLTHLTPLNSLDVKSFAIF